MTKKEKKLDVEKEIEKGLEIERKKKEIEDIFEKLEEMQFFLRKFMQESLEDNEDRQRFVENQFFGWTYFDIPGLTGSLKKTMLDCLSFASEETCKDNGYVEMVSTAVLEDVPANTWSKDEAEIEEDRPVISWCIEDNLKYSIDFGYVRKCPQCDRYIKNEVPYCICGYKFFDSKRDKRLKREQKLKGKLEKEKMKKSKQKNQNIE